MLALVDQGMEEGAFGFSTGLSYARAATRYRELMALCRQSARHGGFFAPHLRSYGATVLESIQEGLDICEQSGCPLHLNPLPGGLPRQ